MIDGPPGFDNFGRPVEMSLYSSFLSSFTIGIEPTELGLQ